MVSTPTEIVFEHRRGESGDPADLVTVAVSCFNYAEYLTGCFDFVAAQTHKSLELIVVDDASALDDSIEVAQAWMRAHADRFDRVLLLRHGRNRGLAAARNTAFGSAAGNFVFVLDADNELYPRAIARLLRAATDGDFAAAYSQLEVFGGRQGLGAADIWEPEWLKHGNYIDAMALLSKRAWFEIGGYSDRGGWEDYDLWCKFVEQGLTAAFVPEILCRYRLHQASMMRTEMKSYDDLFVQMTLAHPWLDLAPIVEI